MDGGVCRLCDEPSVITDPDTGFRVCESCGCVHDSDVFQHQAFTSDGTAIGTITHSAGDFGYRERKLYRARSSITDITSRLGLTAAHSDEVARLASQATDDELGSGNWFPVLVAACAVIVMRKHRSPLSLNEAATAIGHHPYDLGRMVVRVAGHLDLGQLPGLDCVSLLERIMRNFSIFSALNKQKLEEIMGQGRFILHCAMRWFLTTGRHPLPIIAAVLSFVANVNGLVIRVEEIAVEIHAGISTSRVRLKELMEVLVKVSKVLLPWGNDVTVKNIIQHAPVLIRYMELKTKLKSNTVGDDSVHLPNVTISLDDILSAHSDYLNVVQEESKYFKSGERDDINQNMGDDNLQTMKLSAERIYLSHAYNGALDSFSEIFKDKETDDIYGSKRRRRAGLEMDDWIESWEGRWKYDRGLSLEQVLQRTEGYDALPPSFINSLNMRRKRRVKMEAAKHRIRDIRKGVPFIVEEAPHGGEGTRLTELTPSRKRRKRSEAINELDWEDCIIELLLIHQAEEEEIEQGHYNRLLDLYVFSSRGA